MRPETQLTLVGIGVACLLPGLGAIWKTATLRGDVFDDLADRVGIAKSGLSERSVEYLRQIQQRTDEQLGNADDFFDPDKALADPGPLTKWTRKFEMAITARDKLDRRFAYLLFVCKWAFVPALVYVVGIVMSTAVFALEFKPLGVRWCGPVFVGFGLLVGAVITGQYHYLHSKLTSAEILGRDPKEGSA